MSNKESVLSSLLSQTLEKTIETIRAYEISNNRGITAKELSRIRGVALPTIYEQLSKLEKANLIFWQKGKDIGLKPENARFYSTIERERHLADLPVLVSLPDEIIPLAKIILAKEKCGISSSALLRFAMSLKSNPNSKWSSIPKDRIEEAVDEAIKYLLRNVLIERVILQDDTYFFPWSD